MDDQNFEQAKQDIIDQVEDFVKDNQNIGDYTKWLVRILEYLKSLKRKDFF